MAKSNKLLSALCIALALMLCVSMLPGGTFAWFTDNVTNEGSKIQAGTLDIALYQLEKGAVEWTDISNSENPLFTYDLWEPGYTDVKVLKVQNNGTLALKWAANLEYEGEISQLANVIDVYVSTDEIIAYSASRNEISNWDNMGTLAQFIDGFAEATNGHMKAGEVAYLGIALHMQESAGIEYQNMSLGGEFDVVIYATQDTVESDNFDNQYDAVTFVASADQLATAL